MGLALGTCAAKPQCADVTFNVPITNSQNVAFASPPDPNDTAAIVGFMRDVWNGNKPASTGAFPVSDTFIIKGTYCVPKGSQTPKGLEVLVHGITYNKTMWAGQGFEKYNWHAAATARGYASLALDRLGHGDNPQRPDPLNVVQPQLQIDIMHEIFEAIRDVASPVNGLGQAYSKLVFVGHSWGSYLGAAMATQYPNDADALVLTGYSNYFDFSDVINADWASAADFDPARFDPSLPKGYVTITKQPQRTASFFAGNFDPAIPDIDFEGEDTLTSGEIGALPAILGPVAGYTGPVLVVTAVEDAFFCQAPKATCESHLDSTESSFPDASSYDYFAPQNTGHDLTLHYTAQDTFELVHQWLDQKL
ncbi:putative cardiolipin-specific deacylase, mitochondrial [Dichotomopilus funicola]|uniref:Cardiolipin-specific deacylase, mitochondrial n=1 Tax=Dichotomopilus funicola TaxID=1934379 RepID=A0AAN6UW60_9PEZI|nr:putative cardiolipin-specific deacylase, mitochondrial [Dichotomopilus funicola]